MNRHVFDLNDAADEDYRPVVNDFNRQSSWNAMPQSAQQAIINAAAAELLAAPSFDNSASMRSTEPSTSLLLPDSYLTSWKPPMQDDLPSSRIVPLMPTPPINLPSVYYSSSTVEIPADTAISCRSSQPMRMLPTSSLLPTPPTSMNSTWRNSTDDTWRDRIDDATDGRDEEKDQRCSSSQDVDQEEPRQSPSLRSRRSGSCSRTSSRSRSRSRSPDDDRCRRQRWRDRSNKSSNYHKTVASGSSWKSADHHRRQHSPINNNHRSSWKSTKRSPSPCNSWKTNHYHRRKSPINKNRDSWKSYYRDSSWRDAEDTKSSVNNNSISWRSKQNYDEDWREFADPSTDAIIADNRLDLCDTTRDLRWDERLEAALQRDAIDLSNDDDSPSMHDDNSPSLQQHCRSRSIVGLRFRGARSMRVVVRKLTQFEIQCMQNVDYRKFLLHQPQLFVERLTHTQLVDKYKVDFPPSSPFYRTVRRHTSDRIIGRSQSAKRKMLDAQKCDIFDIYGDDDDASSDDNRQLMKKSGNSTKEAIEHLAFLKNSNPLPSIRFKKKSETTEERRKKRQKDERQRRLREARERERRRKSAKSDHLSVVDRERNMRVASSTNRYRRPVRPMINRNPTTTIIEPTNRPIVTKVSDWLQRNNVVGPMTPSGSGGANSIDSVSPSYDRPITPVQQLRHHHQSTMCNDRLMKQQTSTDAIRLTSNIDPLEYVEELSNAGDNEPSSSNQPNDNGRLCVVGETDFLSNYFDSSIAQRGCNDVQQSSSRVIIDRPPLLSHTPTNILSNESFRSNRVPLLSTSSISNQSTPIQYTIIPKRPPLFSSIPSIDNDRSGIYRHQPAMSIGVSIESTPILPTSSTTLTAAIHNTAPFDNLIEEDEPNDDDIPTIEFDDESTTDIVNIPQLFTANCTNSTGLGGVLGDRPRSLFNTPTMAINAPSPARARMPLISTREQRYF